MLSASQIDLSAFHSYLDTATGNLITLRKDDYATCEIFNLKYFGSKRKSKSREKISKDSLTISTSIEAPSTSISKQAITSDTSSLLPKPEKIFKIPKCSQISPENLPINLKINASNSNSILALQLTPNSLTFYNYNPNGKHLELPSYNFTSDEIILDYFWIGRLTLILVFQNSIRTLLVNYNDSIVSYGSFKYLLNSPEKFHWANFFSPKLLPFADPKLLDFYNTKFHKTISVGSDSKIYLFKCEESQVVELSHIDIDLRKFIKSKYYNRSLSRGSYGSRSRSLSSHVSLGREVDNLSLNSNGGSAMAINLKLGGGGSSSQEPQREEPQTSSWFGNFSLPQMIFPSENIKINRIGASSFVETNSVGLFSRSRGNSTSQNNAEVEQSSRNEIPVAPSLPPLPSVDNELVSGSASDLQRSLLAYKNEVAKNTEIPKSEPLLNALDLEASSDNESLPDLPTSPNFISKSSVNIMLLYGELYLSILVKLKHFYQIRLYKIQNFNKPEILSHILHLKRKGRFYLQNFNNLILAHHLEDNETLIFDIAYLPPKVGKIQPSTLSNLTSHDDEKLHAIPYEHKPIAAYSINNLTYSKSWRSTFNNLIYSKKKENLSILKFNLDYRHLMDNFKVFEAKDLVQFYSRRNYFSSTSTLKSKIVEYLKSLIVSDQVVSVPFRYILEDLTPNNLQESSSLSLTPNDQNFTRSEQTDVIGRHEIVQHRGRTRHKSFTSNSKNYSMTEQINEGILLRPTKFYNVIFLNFIEILEKMLKPLNKELNTSSKSKNLIYFTLNLINFGKKLNHKVIPIEIYEYFLNLLLEADQISLVYLYFNNYQFFPKSSNMAKILLRHGLTDLSISVFKSLGDYYIDSILEIYYKKQEYDAIIEYLIDINKLNYLNPIRLLSLVKDDQVTFTTYYKFLVKINHKLKSNKIDFRDENFGEFTRLFRKYNQVA